MDLEILKLVIYFNGRWPTSEQIKNNSDKTLNITKFINTDNEKIIEILSLDSNIRNTYTFLEFEKVAVLVEPLFYKINNLEKSNNTKTEKLKRFKRTLDNYLKSKNLLEKLGNTL